MNILDCESAESAELSLSAILGIPPVQLKKLLQQVSSEQFEIQTSIKDDRWIPMLNRVAGAEIPEELSGNTCWFHATRVANPSTFKEGLHSVGRRFDPTWAFLKSLVPEIPEQKWMNFRKDVEDAHYGQSEWAFDVWMDDGGPCAFLFAEIPLISKDVEIHDFLNVSELVDFILTCFKREYPIDLRSRYIAATKPFLVKFRQPKIKAIHLGATIDYLVRRLTKQSLSYLDPHFSAYGESIEPKDILKVIAINESRLPRGVVYGLDSATR